MAIQFYLEIEGVRHILPVNPGEISVTSGSNNGVVEVIKIGEVTTFGAKTLIETAFSSVFPKSSKVPYFNANAKNRRPSQWVEIINDAGNKNKRVRLIVTDCGINYLTSIVSFTWSYKDATGDVEYSLNLKEYRDHKAKYLKTVAKKVSPAPRPKPATSKPITAGCEVICNGRLHRDSYGTGPGQTEKNARRKVNFIAKGRKCPYHVTLLDGGWRGWVTAGSVRRV